MKPIEAIIEPYIELESAVCERMIQLFSNTCGLCTVCCCRVDICEEATLSAFLSGLLKRQGHTSETMDDRFGWLDTHGCSLEYGRPPICYAFFCDELIARLPDDDTRWSVKLLGRLIEYVGENVVEGRHLVEILNAEDLSRIDTAALLTRIETAQEAVNIIDQYIETGHLLPADRKLLNTITIPEP